MILACHRVRCQDELEFIELPERKVWKFLQMALKPLSVPEFATSLRKASRFPRQSEDTLTIENYNRFYGDLITYTRLFLRVFVFLSHKNTNNIPVVDNKPGGLIKIYLDGIPGEFTKRIMSQLRVSRADSIQSFIEDTFMPMVNDFAQNLRTVKKISPFLDPVPSLKPKTDPRPANSSSPNSERKRGNWPHRRDSGASAPAPAQYEQPSVEQPPDEHEEGDYDQDGNPLKTPSTRDPLDPDEKKFEQDLNAAFSPPPSTERGPGRSYEPGLGDHKTTSCCWHAMQYGTCSKQGCTFAHSPEAISEALAKMVANFSKPKNRVALIMPTRKPPDQPG
jgi:hypothetical protein